MSRLIRIGLAAVLACLTAGLVQELFSVREGGSVMLAGVVDSAITAAQWALPFAVLAIMATEALRLRHVIVFLTGGLAVAAAAALWSRDGLAQVLGVFNSTSTSALLSMGTLAGLVYWLIAGSKAGWRGDADERAIAASQSMVQGSSGGGVKPRCWPCLLFGGLLAALPLIALGYWAFEQSNTDDKLRAQVEQESAVALSKAGYPWAKLRIDGYRGLIEGTAPTEVDREKAFAAATELLAPVTGMPGVIGVIANRMTAPPTPATVASASPTLTAQPAIRSDDSKRLADAAADAKRKADADAEAKRLADATADAKRKADADAEAKRLADAAAEAKRKADADADAKRLADAAADAKRKADADAETKRLADAAAEAKRKADADAEAKRLADAAAAETKRLADEQARTTVVVRTPSAAPTASSDATARLAGTCDADALAAIETGRVSFDTASSDIGAPDRAALQRIADGMKACGNRQFVINGFTDDVGAADYNRALSLRRAEMIQQELAALGIAAPRLTARGFGSDRPIAANTTTEGRASNRRVEFTFDGNLDPRTPENTARVSRCATDFSRLLAAGIVFEPSSATISATSRPRLDEIALAAKGCAAFGLLVEGHADKTGRPEWNVRISDLRARAVRDALVLRGVPAARIDAKGFGSSRLVDPGDSQEAHARNRRIEISIGAPNARSN